MTADQSAEYERNTNPLWDDNSIQFPRLLCEIMATQDNLDLEAIAESMDLNVADVIDVFDRANNEWERAKANKISTQIDRSEGHDA